MNLMFSLMNLQHRFRVVPPRICNQARSAKGEVGSCNKNQDMRDLEYGRGAVTRALSTRSAVTQRR
jgi:hypothetical protein